MKTNDLKPGMLLVCDNNNYIVLPYGPGYIGGYNTTGRIQFDREDLGKDLNDIPEYGIRAVYDIPSTGSLLGPDWFETCSRKILWSWSK